MFTTTGGALCPSGTFEDEFIAQGGNDASISASKIIVFDCLHL